VSTRPALLVSALLLVAGLGPRSLADDAAIPEGWRWLTTARPSSSGVYISPALKIEERAKATVASRSVLALAFSATRGRPEHSRIEGAGVIVRSDGLVAASWQILADVDNACWLWARTHDGKWLRAIPMSSTWWGDVGLCRLVGAPRNLPPIVKADVSDRDFRRRFVAVGTAHGKGLVAGVGRLQAAQLFDPEAKEGHREVNRTRTSRGGKHTTVLALRFEGTLATRGGPGTPVFDPETGRCVGLVTATWAGEGSASYVLVRPWSYLEHFLAPIRRDVVFDPPDFGVRWAPAPTMHAEPSLASTELLRSREYVSGGALVKYVLPSGPANRVLWEGDVVVEIEGRPVFGEVYESLAMALVRLHTGVPADVVVVRGGERQTLQVMPKRISDIYPDYDEHEARASRLRRARSR
jgi:S1-C subfamily serine protease